MAQREKKKRTRYDIHLLTTLCLNNNIELLEDYSDKHINCYTIIKGNCINKDCKNDFNKNLIQLYCIGGYCKSCTNNIKSIKYKKKFMEKHGVENPSQLQKVKEQKKLTCLRNFGVENPFQSEVIKDKINATNIEKFGVENPIQSQEVKDKIRATNMEKFGVENPFQSEVIKDKIKETNMEKFGVENPHKSQEVKDKTKETNIERYGFEYPAQNPKIAEKASKNAYKSKDYIFPSGRIVRIQGYENLMLDELLQKENMTENDIIVSRKDVPDIWYKDENGKEHRYFVDCYIPSQQRCIEVKSTWTAEKKKDCIFLKQNAVKDAGYKCEIWIYNSKGEKVQTYM